MNCEQFAEHLMDCLEDGLDIEAAGEVKAHLDECPDCRRQARELTDLWEALPAADPGLAVGETPSGRLRERFDESLGALIEAQSLKGTRRRPAQSEGRVLAGPWTRTVVTALAASLAVGVALGFFVGGQVTTRAEVEALRTEMRAVNETVAVALMNHTTASERLRGIALSSDNLEAIPGDSRVIDALFERVRNDPNDNVRLAAVEALAGAVDRAEVRDGLADSIGYQESPEVQAVVLETLARTDRSAVDAALSSDDLDDDVRQWFLAVAPSFVG